MAQVWRKGGGKLEHKWLEDFLILAETRSFSRAAELRHVTQSAFSRRIQALEMWLGAPLLDRSSYPVALTPEGRHFRETAEEVVRLLNAQRHGSDSKPLPVITTAALHTLSITFFPHWLAGIRDRIGPCTSKVMSDNFLICIQTLIEGGYDFLMTYAHPSVPIPLDPARFVHLVIGQDSLLPVSVPNLKAPLLDGRLPLLQYSRGSFLGLITAQAQRQEGAPATYLAHTNENSMAEALKYMVLAGHGMAWLPRSLIVDEVASGRLIVVGPELQMEIRLYRSAERSRRFLDQVWQAAAQGYAKPA